MRLIDADALYEKTAEWEAQALHMTEFTANDEDKTEWRKWSAVLKERSAFKYDIADSPTIEERKKGKWEGLNADKEEWKRTDGSPIFMSCSLCCETVLNNGSAHWNFCPNCGADMRGETNVTLN